jgi:hypothetical protein
MDTVIILFFVLAVVVPIVIVMITRYRDPKSVRSSLWQIGTNALIIVATYAVLDFLRRGTTFADWRLFQLLPAVAIGAAAAILVDLIILRRRRMRDQL